MSVPVPPWAVTVRVVFSPVLRLDGDAVKPVISGWGLTVNCNDSEFAYCPGWSVTVALIVYVPGVSGLHWIVVEFVETQPDGKRHVSEYVEVPPWTVVENETVWLTSATAGTAIGMLSKGSGAIVTFIVPLACTSWFPKRPLARHSIIILPGSWNSA